MHANKQTHTHTVIVGDDTTSTPNQHRQSLHIKIGFNFFFSFHTGHNDQGSPPPSPPPVSDTFTPKWHMTQHSYSVQQLHTFFAIVCYKTFEAIQTHLLLMWHSKTIPNLLAMTWNTWTMGSKHTVPGTAGLMVPPGVEGVWCDQEGGGVWSRACVELERWLTTNWDRAMCLQLREIV